MKPVVELFFLRLTSMEAGRDQELKVLLLKLPVNLLPCVVAEESERRYMDPIRERHSGGRMAIYCI